MAFDANDLSPHEHFVVDRTRLGEVADFTPMAGPGGQKPSVRAGFLRKLMLQLDPEWAVRTPGVRLKGVRIEGALDLTDCSGAGGAGLPALSLEQCDVPDVIDVSHARLARLSLEGSKLRRLFGAEATIDGEFNFSQVAPFAVGEDETLYIRMRAARINGDVRGGGAKLARASDSTEFSHPSDAVLYLQSARIGGNILLGDGFDALGCIWLMGAEIGGTIELSGGQVLNRSADAAGSAFVAANARIAGNVLMRGGFKAEGEVDLMSARIGGTVDLSQSSFKNGGGFALKLTSAEIDGDVQADMKAIGQVAMQCVEIKRNLDLRGAEITHALTPRGDSFGIAIDGTSLRVAGALLMQGANIKGETLLADARIDGYLAFGGGRFINGGGWAIRAPNARVGGNVTMKIEDGGFAPHGQKTVIEGGAKFDRAQIDGAFTWLNLELRGPGPDGAKGAIFSLADAAIRGPLQARALTAQQESSIDLSGATCSSLDDDLKTGWGVDRAALDLDGFSYGRLESTDDRAGARLAWLRRAKRFAPQPYTMLAQVYARAGKRGDARKVLLRQHDEGTLRASSDPVSWLFSSAFGIIAGYGFAPLRALRALVVFIAIGIAGVLAMNAQGALVTPDGRQCNGAVEPALYAIDVALPVIDLGQESRCAPGRTARAELSAGTEIANSEWRLFEGASMWKWAQAVYAVLGAILSALAVITFSGVMKPKDD